MTLDNRFGVIQTQTQILAPPPTLSPPFVTLYKLLNLYIKSWFPNLSSETTDGGAVKLA